ncbi:sucrose-6-phosphate hydrolase [Guptibacillus algicola]|uniref:sucrose-6-phosphate hydrolase n=1 Tax=Guptibacillus algicola TaxID=225844 RepID=UPI001CD6821C|nr:sucrose-6-phosphate hydrolase [Alkalihalobacillus algicola]MCA0988832.1 sucrose-6-phosphate hydrolase [Alkalihalobacillus algicola]
MTSRNEELVALAMEEIEKAGAVVKSDPHLPSFHLMPPVGLLNDPNGFIQWNGVYHVFFQWMPFKTEHGAKFWGHYTSTDLVNWTLRSPALAPGDWFDKNGCYSGSAVAHDDKMVLFYTGNVKDEGGNRESYQCMAESSDGITFDKKGVVLELPEGYTPHFRDPKVWKHEDKWFMVIGAQNSEEEGRVVLFESLDLTRWEYKGDVTASRHQKLGEFGYMWECPDLFELDGSDVLLFSPQGIEAEGYSYQNVYQTGYLSGELDYETGILNHDTFRELDRGFEFYAPQTTEDEKGRRLLIGWMGVPEQGEAHQPTRKHHWLHTLTIPRELRYRGGKLIQKPVAELDDMRQNEVVKKATLSNEKMEWKEGNTTVYELLVKVKDVEGSFSITFRNNAAIVFDSVEKLLTLKRRRFVDGSEESRSCHIESVSELRFYVDSSSIEVFINGGEEVFTSRYFPAEEDDSLVFKSNGKADIEAVKWDISNHIKV